MTALVFICAMLPAAFLLPFNRGSVSHFFGFFRIFFCIVFAHFSISFPFFFPSFFLFFWRFSPIHLILNFFAFLLKFSSFMQLIISSFPSTLAHLVPFLHDFSGQFFAFA